MTYTYVPVIWIIRDSGNGIIPVQRYRIILWHYGILSFEENISDSHIKYVYFH